MYSRLAVMGVRGRARERCGEQFEIVLRIEIKQFEFVLRNGWDSFNSCRGMSEAAAVAGCGRACCA